MDDKTFLDFARIPSSFSTTWKMALTTLSPVVKADYKGRNVHNVISIPFHGLLLFTCQDDVTTRVVNEADGKIISPSERICQLVHMVAM